jgi:RecG-like helicase
MTSVSLIKGIGTKRAEELDTLGISSIEELAVATTLPPKLEKYKQEAIDYLKKHKKHTTKEEVKCINFTFDKHTWLGASVQLPVGKECIVSPAKVEEIVLEHGERLVVLCRDTRTKKTSSWQIPTLTVLNPELPPLRLTMSQEDMDNIHCLEYVLRTLWESDYIRSCIQPE